MKRKIKFKRQLSTYLRWPLILAILLIIINTGIYFINIRAGIFLSIGVLVYTVICLVLYFYNRSSIVNEMISFASRYGQMEQQLLKELSIPYVLFDMEGNILWGNDEFWILTGKKETYRRSVSSIFPELNDTVFSEKEKAEEVHLRFEEKDYKVELKRMDLRETISNNKLISLESEDEDLFVAYFYDETALNQYIRENKEQKLVAGLVYIDNYEEILESVEEVRRSLLAALIERKINKYFSGVGGVVKKLDKEKFFVIFKYKYLSQLTEGKFSLLSEVKTVNIGNEMAVTVSMGFGINGASYVQNCEYSRVAIDLALGRGGDQAVLKDGEQISYFGGNSQQIEKNTRVKARVKAQALHEIMVTKEKVMVMGHKITDVDSFGAAIGIYCAGKAVNKRVHIVINDVTTSIRPMMENFLHKPEYEPEMFVNNSQALELVDENTVVVVVDTNKPNYTECKELLQRAKTIVVLDHHRQGAEVIDNAVLSYIEPFASSACEMVAEILQYFDEGVKIRNLEADCIYAGIIIDTNSFTAKTGVRTFEAAAFLRRNGADVTRVRKLFRDEMGTYKARAEAVRHAELLYDRFAISVCPSEHLESPTIVGAQAANELLNIIGVQASFVMTYYNNETYISARSIDEINVQVIMEKLGGGGHMTIAGAQLKCGIEEAKELLKNILSKMMNEGDI